MFAKEELHNIRKSLPDYNAAIYIFYENPISSAIAICGDWVYFIYRSSLKPESLFNSDDFLGLYQIEKVWFIKNRVSSSWNSHGGFMILGYNDLCASDYNIEKCFKSIAQRINENEGG